MGKQLDARHDRKENISTCSQISKKNLNVVFKQGLIKTWQAYGIECNKQKQFKNENNVDSLQQKQKNLHFKAEVLTEKAVA